MTTKQFYGSGELVSATLRGYRCWTVTTRDPAYKLRAVSAGVTWEGTDMRATCSKLRNNSIKGLAKAYMEATYSNNKHEKISNADLEEVREALKHPNGVPSDQCTCGVYGWYEPESALIQHSAVVMGVIECKGRILLGTTGFRAEEAKMVAITTGNQEKVNEFMGMRYSRRIRPLIDAIDKWIVLENGVMTLNYGKLQDEMDNSAEGVHTAFSEDLEQIGKDYGVEVLPSMEELKEKYPPQLDTLENVLEGKLQRYVR